MCTCTCTCTLNVHCLQLLCTYFIQTHEHLFRVHSFISTVGLIKWVIFLSFFYSPRSLTHHSTLAPLSCFSSKFVRTSHPLPFSALSLWFQMNRNICQWVQGSFQICMFLLLLFPSECFIIQCRLRLIAFRHFEAFLHIYKHCIRGWDMTMCNSSPLSPSLSLYFTLSLFDCNGPIHF